MEIKLSILIATMPSRMIKFNALRASLTAQNKEGHAEIISDDSMGYNIGVKRNKLLAKATGEYVTFIDDDDIVSDCYIDKILRAIETKPDCIGIAGVITFNGKNQKQWYISKELGDWYEKDNIYYRTPNHISPVRTELALQAGFPEISFGEDRVYSRNILPLLKTEILINENIYHYDYWEK
jgi:glycosyltransferase involved in cell wall biosynthesis